MKTSNVFIDSIKKIIETGVRDSIWSKYKLVSKKDCLGSDLDALSIQIADSRNDINAFPPGMDNVVGIFAIMAAALVLAVSILLLELILRYFRFVIYFQYF